MARETEIKLRIDNVPAFIRALTRMGARALGHGSGRVFEENVIFDTPQGGLAKHGQLLRIRTETSDGGSRKGKANLKRRVLLTFKRPVARAAQAEPDSRTMGSHKVREEIEVEVGNAVILTKIFEGLGMSGWFRYEKYRTTFQLPAKKSWARGLLIELDETPIGTFVELEGPGLAIDRAAEELGFSKRDYVLKNYLVLYLEECRLKGHEPRQMVFQEAKRRSKPSSVKK